MKKIVAIGGGENGRTLKNGESAPYETSPMDKEIIKLTNKEKPNFLFLGHSQPLNIQDSYFNTMERIYGEKYKCNCKMLKSDELNNIKKVKNLIEWADIIYEGGGDTLTMIQLWKDTSFDKILKKAWEDGKVMCGVSAGGICWFNSCNSDSMIIQNGNDEELISVDCLNFINAYVVPHCDENGRYDSAKKELKKNGLVGILLSNCCALEIIDDKYRFILSDATYHGIKSYAKKMYWIDDTCFECELEVKEEFQDLNLLLTKWNKCIK